MKRCIDECYAGGEATPFIFPFAGAQSRNVYKKDKGNEKHIQNMGAAKESGLLGLWGLLAAGAALSERRAMPGRRSAGWLSRGPPGAGLQRLTPGG